MSIKVTSRIWEESRRTGTDLLTLLDVGGPDALRRADIGEWVKAKKIGGCVFSIKKQNPRWLAAGSKERET